MARLSLPAAAVLLFVVALPGGVAALYEKDGPVLQLGTRTFDKVTQSKVPVVVEFFAPWCGHCKNLAPAFARAAAKLQGIVPFVAVDCDRESNRPLCSQFGVQGFPTIKLFTPGSAAPRDYQGERSAKALVDAATDLLTAKHVARLKTAADAAAFAGGAGTKVVLVSDKADTPGMLKSLSQRFAAQGLSFARVQAKSADDPAATELLEKLGGPVAALPALFALGPDGSRTMYQGETKAPKILEWLKQFARGKGAGASSSSGSADSSGNSAGAGDGKQEKQQQGKEEGRKVPAEIPQVVSNVTAAELARRLEKEGVLVVSFFAGSPAGCAEHRNKLNAAVHGLQGLATGLQVDLSEEAEAAAVRDLYSVSLEDPGQGGCQAKTFLLPFDPETHEDSDDWLVWDEELSARELYKAAVELFPAAGVVHVTEQTYMQFTTLSDPRNVKVLLFTEKEEPPALLRALSANFRAYKMDFGLVHGSQAQLMEQFHVNKVPHLAAVFAVSDPDGKPAAQGQQIKMTIQPYGGPLRYGPISGWLTMLGLQLGSAPEEVARQFVGQQRDAMVAQVTDQASWEASCVSKGGICLVAALSADPSAQAAQLEQLRGAAEGRGEQPLHFCWVAVPEGGNAAGQGGAEGAVARLFAERLGLSAGSVPSLAAVAPKKERGVVLAARFDKAAISEWLDGLLSGKVRTVPLTPLPAFPTPDEVAGAGGGAEEAAVEEEFDLSDIMSEEVEGDLSKIGRREEL